MSEVTNFRNLERKVERLEENYDNYLEGANETVDGLKNIEFDESKYGKNAIDKRINELYQGAKKEIEDEFSYSYRVIKERFEDSYKRIADKVEDLKSNKEQYENLLNKVTLLNQEFKNRDYEKVIKHSFDEFNNEQNIFHYFLLLKAKSYHYLVEDKLNSNNEKNMYLFLDYIKFSADNNAPNHLKDASKNYIIFLYNLLTNNVFMNDASKYYYLKFSLKVKNNIDENKNLDEKLDFLYKKFFEIYNGLADEYYSNFKYKKFISLLNDSTLLRKEDIDNEILKAQEISDSVKLDFIKEKGNVGSKEDINDVLNDLKPLLNSDKKEEYVTTMLSLIRDENNDLFALLLNQIHEQWSYSDFLKNINLFINKSTGDLNYYNTLIDFYIKFTKENSSNIPLLHVVNSLISLCEKTNLNSLTHVEDFYTLSLLIIRPNAKYLASMDEHHKKAISNIFNEGYYLIYHKHYKKDILSVKKSIFFDEKLIVSVKNKLFMKNNKKKVITLVSILGVVLVATIIALLIFLL